MAKMHPALDDGLLPALKRKPLHILRMEIFGLPLPLKVALLRMHKAWPLKI
jgi:hypothetical protein